MPKKGKRKGERAKRQQACQHKQYVRQTSSQKDDEHLQSLENTSEIPQKEDEHSQSLESTCDITQMNTENSILSNVENCDNPRSRSLQNEFKLLEPCDNSYINNMHLQSACIEQIDKRLKISAETRSKVSLDNYKSKKLETCESNSKNLAFDTSGETGTIPLWMQSYLEDQKHKEVNKIEDSAFKQISDIAKDRKSRSRTRKTIQDMATRTNTEWRRLRRRDENLRKSEQSRDTRAKQLKRKNVNTKQTEQEKNTQFRQDKRKDPSFKLDEQRYNTEFKREKRKNPELRQREQVKDTQSRQDKRKNTDLRREEQEKDTRSRNNKRKDPIYKENELCYNTEFRKNKRKDPDVRRVEQEKETKSKQEKRKNPDMRRAEQDKGTQSKRERRKNPDVRQAEQDKATQSKREKRKNPDMRQAEQDKATQSKRERRKDPDMRQAEQDKATPSKREKRKNLDMRQAEQRIDTQLRRNKRKNPETRSNEQSIERASKRKKRSLPSSIDEAIILFHQKITEGPSYVCISCCRLLYRTSVSYFKKEKYANIDQELLTSCTTSKKSYEGNEYICNTCKNSLQKGEMPAISVANGMQLDELPQELHDLNSLESILISRRIPFIKMIGLPSGKQKSVHGCVVNIPIEPEESLSVLPRTPTSDAFITVKLKRKLMYRGHVYMQNIRPKIIEDALHIIKHELNNFLYQDVILNNNWRQEAQANDPSLWNSLTGENDSTDIDQQSDHEDNEHNQEADEENDPEEIEDERSRLSGLPFDSCIQPKDITTDTNIILNFAPGENKKPKSFYDDEHNEELSFPQLLPTGKFGFSMPRSKKLSLKKYFQARILNEDNRFASNIQYLFYAQYRCEVKEIQDCLSIALRKGKEHNITAGEIRENLSQFIRNDLGVQFMQKIRGSPAYFNKLFYDLLGIIRHLGPATWFVTLSAADLKWPDTLKVIAEQQGVSLTADEIAALTWEEKCNYLRSNPVTAARHFDNRVSLFLKHILMNKRLNPLGEITDFKYRIEFQHRGSPHVHMLAWSKNAPSIDSDSPDEILDFLDSKITCQIPEDETLAQLICTVQRHSHSVACRKHGKNCRFSFPRPPLKSTMLFKPLEDVPSKTVQHMYSAILTSVYAQLETSTEWDSLDQLLDAAKVTEQDYIDALHWIKTKSGQPAILLKRSPSEVNVNNYNTTLMKAWEANLDVQFVTNVYSCVMYLASYVSKPERTLGDVLKAVSTSSQHLGAKMSMKSVAQKFLTHREVSAQEAVYRLLSLPLSQGSRQIVFIDTDLPENRTRLFKPMKVLEQLDEDDPDVFLLSILDKYQNRPNNLENMCLSEFVSKYKTTSKPPPNEARAQQDEDSEDEETPKHIILKKDMGQMLLRKTPAIVRYHQWSKKKNFEQYFHSQLLLYFPWRRENEDLFKDSYKDSYQDKLEIIRKNRNHFENFADEVVEVLEDMEEFGIVEESWHAVAPEAEKERIEQEDEGFEVEQSPLNAFESNHQVTASSLETRSSSFQYEMLSEKMPTTEWMDCVLSLNDMQYELHQYIVNWATKMTLTHRTTKPDPFHLFLTGGAGVGKSHVVRTLVQTVNRIFAINNQADENHVLVCAPTGAAAYNISGYTCHAAFLLPLHTKKTDDYIPLSNEKLSIIKETFSSIKLIVIDEISMVGTDTLLTIHRRLCDITSNTQPFGGMSILAVGDLLQLPAVAQRPIFTEPSDEMSAIYGSLWQTHFKIVELEEIQRQKNDTRFATLLNRVRVGDETNEDIDLLNTRQTFSSSENYPQQATHIFAYNKDVNAHNSLMLNALPEQLYSFIAKDSRRDEQTRRVELSAFADMAGGLPKTLVLGVGAHVVLTKNIDVSDGLVNSAVGIVTGFIPEPIENMEAYSPKYVMVKFNDTRVGRKRREEHRSIILNTYKDSTPISQIEVPIPIGKSSKITSKRTQFPLNHSWALTIHKEQGKTEDTLVLSVNGSFHPGQFYTAISRTKTLEGLHILGKVERSKIKVNKNSLKEIERMKSEAPFISPVPQSLQKSSNVYLKIHFLNIRSLIPHFASLMKDEIIEQSHITSLAETWLISSDEHPEIRGFNSLRCDRPNSHDQERRKHRSGGLLFYVHQDFYIVKEYKVRGVELEYQMMIVSPAEDRSVRLVILSIYNNPNNSSEQFFFEMEKLLHEIPDSVKSFVIGDFNIDILKNTASAKKLLHLMKYYGFHQLCKQPTHRRGGLIDHLYTNIYSKDVVLSTIPLYYTDHQLLSAAIPLKCLQ